MCMNPKYPERPLRHRENMQTRQTPSLDLGLKFVVFLWYNVFLYLSCFIVIKGDTAFPIRVETDPFR